MYDAKAEADAVALQLRRVADRISPERRLRVPGAAKAVLGLRKPELLGALTGWLAQRQAITEQELLETCRYLWIGQTREEQVFATRVLARRAAGLTTQRWDQILQWLDGVDSVESADSVAIYLVGPWAAHDVPARLPSLRTLLGTGDLVRKRVALVATTRIRAHESYPAVVEEFVRTLVADRDPLVIDALAWALCALSRQHRPAVESILRTSTALHPLAKEQVHNWLRTGSRRGLVTHDWRLPGAGPTAGLL